MTLVREDDFLCGRDPNLESLKDYLGSLEKVTHGRYRLDLLK